MSRIRQEPASPGAMNPPSPNLGSAIERLSASKSLQEIGARLQEVSALLPKEAQVGPVTQAVQAASRNEPSGLRPLAFGLDEGKNVSLFLGSATPESARRRAEEEAARQPGARIAPHHFQIFSTGDPFVFLGVPKNKATGEKALPENVAKRTVVVVQGDVQDGENESAKFDRATLVAEALQIATAARENDAKRVVLVLPGSLDASRHPEDRLAKLVGRLLSDPALGVDEVHFREALDTPPAALRLQSGLRPGLVPLGPKLEGATAALQLLHAATDLPSVQRAIARLGVELSALSAFEHDARVIAREVVRTLTDKVTKLIPGLPSGAAGQIGDKTVVFSGQSNPALAKDVAATLKAELGSSYVDFHGGVPYPSLVTKVKDRPVVVVQTSREDPGKAQDARNSSMGLLVEALLLCDAAKEAGAKDVSLVLPYMPSARSDKKDQDGVGTYAKLVARWIDAVGVNSVVLVEPHDPHVPYFFGTRNIRVVSGATVLAKHIIETTGSENLVLVRPDAGAQKRTKGLADALDLPIVDGEKSRAGNDEKASVDALGSKSDVDGKRCLVIDDEIATGGTMRQVCERLKGMGAAEVIVAVSHANMPDTLEARHESMRQLRASGADKLYLLDTQPVGALPADLQSFVTVVSAAEAISDRIF